MSESFFETTTPLMTAIYGLFDLDTRAAFREPANADWLHVDELVQHNWCLQL